MFWWGAGAMLVLVSIIGFFAHEWYVNRVVRAVRRDQHNDSVKRFVTKVANWNREQRREWMREIVKRYKRRDQRPFHLQ